MSIIDKMLFREVMKTLSVILFILLIIIMSSYMVNLLSKAASGALQDDVLLLLGGFYALKVIASLIAPAFFFALLWVLGGMYRDGEMIALQSSGVGLVRIYLTTMISAVPLAILSAVLVMVVVPWASSNIKQVTYDQSKSVDIYGLKPGKFNEHKQGDLVMYIEKVSEDGSKLENVFVQDLQQGSPGVVVANEAYQTTDPQTGERYIILGKGTRYEGKPGQNDYQIATFDEYAIRIPQFKHESSDSSTKEQTTAALLSSDSIKARTELQHRISIPVAVIIFAILSIPLAKSQPRKDVFGRMSLSILVYFIFINLQRVAERWMEYETTPSWLGTWWVSLLMLFIAAFIVFLDSSWLAVKLREVNAYKQSRESIS